MEVKQGSQCVYVGPGPGRGVRHVVAMVLQEDKGVEVITWSKPDPAMSVFSSPDLGVAGYSFLGSFDDFRACFRYV